VKSPSVTHSALVHTYPNHQQRSHLLHIHLATCELMPCHCHLIIGHRQLGSTEFCLVLRPPSSSSSTCNLLSTFLSPHLSSSCGFSRPVHLWPSTPLCGIAVITSQQLTEVCGISLAGLAQAAGQSLSVVLQCVYNHL